MPLGLTFLLVIVRAIVSAFLVNRFLVGYVETVFTLSRAGRLFCNTNPTRVSEVLANA